MELWELDAREQVRHVVSVYTHAADTGRSAVLAGCFTEHGVLDVGDGRRVEGRAAIEAFLDEQKARLAGASTSSLVRHHVSSVRITVDDHTSATAASYFFVVTDIGPDHWGRYRDRFEPEDGRWLIAERRVTVDGHAPGSLMAG